MPINIPHKSPLATQMDVIWALYLRETKTRFGVYKLGLIWAIIEPLTSTIVIGLLLGMALQRTVPHIPYPFFILCGFVPYSLFTNTLSSATTALGANQGLLAFRQVTPLDSFIARLLLEVVFSTASFMLFMFAGIWLGVVPDFPRPIALAISLLSLLMITVGAAVTAGVYARYHSEIKKVLPLLMRPMLFMSCVIFPLRLVPPDYQAILLLNPLTGIIETIRASMFSGYSDIDISLFYPFACGVIMLSYGLSYYWRERKILCEEPRT